MAAVLSYPGVYIEEIPSGVRTIAGVATSITAMVGRTRRGPLNRPVRVFSFGEFERVFGGLWDDAPLTFAALHCFQNGGSDLLVVRVAADNAASSKGSGRLELGIRPEFVTFADKGLPVDVVKVSDIGRYRVVDTRLGENSVKLIVPEGGAIPEGKAHLAFDKAHTQIYSDGWLAGEAR